MKEAESKHTATIITQAQNEPGLSAYLESKLLDSLRHSLPQALNSQWVWVARNECTDVIGGLVCATAYSWLHVEVLWVHDEHRGAGIGTALMRHAETQALDHHCHNAWLDTSSPDAKSFYERLGYSPFGQLSNTPDQSPATHQRWFLKKTLSAVQCHDADS